MWLLFFFGGGVGSVMDGGTNVACDNLTLRAQLSMEGVIVSYSVSDANHLYSFLFLVFLLTRLSQVLIV